MRIGDKIRTLRKNSGMSQEVLAQKLNVNRNCLSRVETGKVDPTITMVKEIAVIFKIDIASLVDLKTSSLDYEQKIKYITDGCYQLTEKDLDFVMRVVSVLSEEYVKRSSN